jgi:hypothetical protein
MQVNRPFRAAFSFTMLANSQDNNNIKCKCIKDIEFKNSFKTKSYESIAADEIGKSCLGQNSLWSDHEAELLRAFRSRRRQVFKLLKSYI